MFPSLGSLPSINNDINKNSENDNEKSYLKNNLRNNFCEHFIEQDDGNAIENETINLQFANRSHLPADLGKHEKILTKIKYDVGNIRVEPQKIYLTSNIPISI